MIAANKSGLSQTISFNGKLFRNKWVQVLFQDQAVVVKDRVLADELEPFGVRVYLLDKI